MHNGYGYKTVVEKLLHGINMASVRSDIITGHNAFWKERGVVERQTVVFDGGVSVMDGEM